ncbi:hypothetical protein BpV1_051 [Bathycoccus sp. RCC1105 virus BpV1]|uniref:hypothetical protein n=1 Tax=Bathycoccus sp. RCC1105 virus BpV1 TaxID=880159 RepID=UPI0001EF43B6|nr:hypothetical protein BpV1_051 [Bathycoccus sp. RCC1105 virus BpV1]ADQ91678.1 hypothetical protein BpV1_051 [Bathycoccus sp. RCC1105 virus BpV1]
MTGCNTGRNIQKYKGSGGTASTLQEALENSNIATIDINLISGAKFRGDGSALTGISGSGGAVGNLQQVTNQDNQTTNSIIITNTGTSLTTSGSINASGNITAPSFIGSGTSLTGIALAVNTSSNAARVSVLETDLTSNVSRVSGLETDLASNSSRIATVSTDLSSNASRVGVLETGLVSNSTRIATVSTDLASNSTRIATVSTDLASNSTRIATVSTDLASNSTRITTVSTDLASNSTRIATVSTDLASNSTRIATVSTDLASNSTRIATISTDLASNSTRIGTVSTDLASNVVRIGDLELEVQPVNRGGTNIISYGTGDMLYASAPSALSKLTPSTAGYFLQTNGTGNAPTWENVANIGSATPANIYTDDYITGGPWSGLTDANIRVLGNVSNLSNQLVARDDKGDIFVSNVNAIRINGDGTFLTGVALSVDLVSNVTRIGNLESNLTANSTRITNLQNSTIISNSSGITNGFETGDLIYASGQNTLSNLSIGSTSQVLTVSGGIPVWAAASGGGGGGGGYWTQNVNNDVYYNTGSVGISNTAPTNTLDIGSNVSINDSASDVLSVRSGNTFIEKNLFVGGVITSPVGGSMNIDTMTVRSLNVRNMVVVAERPPKNIILN